MNAIDALCKANGQQGGTIHQFDRMVNQHLKFRPCEDDGIRPNVSMAYMSCDDLRKVAIRLLNDNTGNSDKSYLEVVSLINKAANLLSGLVIS